uniref:Uncharacterized protein n=1 Tax=Anguilla anguilla TaxID=7936 RepID=A0A0E9V993_ANGAN
MNKMQSSNKSAVQMHTSSHCLDNRSKIYIVGLLKHRKNKFVV